MEQSYERSPEDFTIAALSDAADDLGGVYEVWRLAPGWRLSARLQLAEETVASLATNGLVALCRGDWTTAESNPLRPEEIVAVLGDWATWTIPNGPEVFMFATADGGARLRRLAEQRRIDHD